MRGVPGTNNVRLHHGKFLIEKTMNHESVYFGSYPTLIMALMVRDKLIRDGWPLSKRKCSNRLNKYITKLNGKFVIYKTINNKTQYFGSYETLQEAIDVRDALVSADWPYIMRNKKHNLPKYIQRNMVGSYQIIKKFKGKSEHFGTFHKLDDAVDERNKLIKCDWDYDLLVEME